MRSIRHMVVNRYHIIIRAMPVIALAVLLILPAFRLFAQSPVTGNSATPDSALIPIVIAIVVVVVLFAGLGGYFFWNRRHHPARSLLMVSTDEQARLLVKNAALRVGYAAITVYRYEDALDKLRQDITISMIIIDDSVPQYEAGMLLSMLQRLPIGIRPLILIHDSSEAGQTAPSYRAEVVVERPITERALEDAIRKVSERVEIDW